MKQLQAKIKERINTICKKKPVKTNNDKMDQVAAMLRARKSIKLSTQTAEIVM